MVSLACVIIMLHATVPHHHHDCEEGRGIIFETEMACHCDHDCTSHRHADNHHSHHPFDTCRLQLMLSNLVISTSDDQGYFSALIKAEAQDFFVMMLPEIVCLDFDLQPEEELPDDDNLEMKLPTQPLLWGVGLRAPPMA